MQQGRGGMGSHKHGVSGHATQSPRLRLSKKLAAEQAIMTRHRGGERASNSRRCKRR